MYTCACESTCIGTTHGVASSGPLEIDDANKIARVMSALATASRVRILASLRIQPRTVGELASTLAMEQPAVSHQLRLLRDLGLVLGERQGRTVTYRLYDSHVAALVAEALQHLEHRAARTPDRVKARNAR